MNRKSDAYILSIDADHLGSSYFRDCFFSRQLFYFFIWRDFIVRYKHTFLGLLWALIRPLINMVIFAFVFGKIANLSSGTISYPLFVLAGMVPWQFFANCLIDSQTSILNNAALITKIYFPRAFLPMASIFVNVLDFTITAVMMVALIIFFGYSLSIHLVFLPLMFLLLFTLCCGVSFWFSAFSARFRDARFILPFILQLGMFISPVGYSGFLVPEKWQWIYFFNPLAGIIEGFRWVFFGVYHPGLPFVLCQSICVSGIILLLGWFYFRRVERSLADFI